MCSPQCWKGAVRFLAYSPDFNLVFDRKFLRKMLFCHFETVQHEIEIGNFVNAVLLDLSKAFDSLSRQFLRKNLQALHFSPSAMHIVENFLTDRLQQVSVIGELKQGVRQGKVKESFFNQFLCESSSRTYERNCSIITVCWRLFNFLKW